MNVAFIPVRGGSKSIPLKNIKIISGKPLVYWTAKAANDCKYIDKVYIATDSVQIAEKVEELALEKVEVIGRSAETATDTAATESAMLEFAAKYEFDNVVLIQATSPLLTAEELNGGFELFTGEDTDSVLSVVRQKRFCWEEDEKGFALPTNYDINNRPRRQDFQGYLVENGAFYITSKSRLLSTGCRMSGRIRAYEMDEATYFEIDEPSDWEIIEHELRKRETEELRIPEIKMFLTDCDGVLTDGGMYYSENGDELKKFNTRDGMGLGLLREKGILTGIVTGESRELNRRRSEKLRMDIYEAGVKDKLAVVKQLCEKWNVALENVAYIGDDINDTEVIKAVGLGCCVADAVPEVKQVAKYITNAKGGHGAVREVVNRILKE